MTDPQIPVATPATNQKSPLRVLRVDSSMRNGGSVTRALSEEIVQGLAAGHAGLTVTTRDLAAQAIPFVDEAWIGANFTDPDARSDVQKSALALSDALVAEVRDADVLVIGVPIYNFGIPAALKAWFDMICRARVTFRYTETGPVGLLTGKRAIVVIASGGVPMGSAVDFATPLVRQVLNFIGITDITIVAADGLSRDTDKLASAKAAIPAAVNGVLSAAA